MQSVGSNIVAFPLRSVFDNTSSHPTGGAGLSVFGSTSPIMHESDVNTMTCYVSSRIDDTPSKLMIVSTISPLIY